MRNRRPSSPDQQPSLIILTTGTILAIGTGAAGIALIPYLQGHGELTLVKFQRLSVLGLLLASTASYFGVIAFGVPALVATIRQKVARLQLATLSLTIQATTSSGVVLTVFWSLLIGAYTESPSTSPSTPVKPLVI